MTITSDFRFEMVSKKNICMLNFHYSIGFYLFITFFYLNKIMNKNQSLGWRLGNSNSFMHGWVYYTYDYKRNKLY